MKKILSQLLEKIKKLFVHDLSDDTVERLRKARKDRESGKKDAYVKLDSI